MHLFALAVALASTPPAPPQPKVPERVVALEDRSITLPRLPPTGALGRSGFKEVHGQVGQAMADLNASLRTLYGRPEAAPLPDNLSVPQELAEEGAALVQVIDDETYARLERAYLDTWKAWQAALADGGLAQRAHPGGSGRAPQSKAFQETREKARQWLKAPSRRFVPVTRAEAGYRAPEEDDTFTPQQLGATPLKPEERKASELAPDKVELDTQSRLGVTDLLLPDLAARWDALAEHLNAVALKVLVREEAAAPTPDAPMMALRAHAKLAVLERFRKALYHCDLVWCQVASSALPKPPPRLAP